MRVVIGGGSGFLGRHLRTELVRRGHTVTTLVRRSAGPDESTWDPYAGTLDQHVVADADVVVNLAGSSTLGNPHSSSWARELRESRVTTTRVLAEAVAACERPPDFLAGNGIDYYGDHSGAGDPVLDERGDSLGEALLTSLCREWQAATTPAQDAGARVCVLRTSPVMDRRSAPLKQLKLLFGFGLGGRLGSGHQHFPMISLRDWVGGVAHLVESPDVAGPVNLCCPHTPTNVEFTRALADLLHRPAFAAVPSVVLRVAAGRLSPQLLGSVNARPAALEAAGYEFRDTDVRDVLSAGLSAASA